jgi:hypothetical protein
MIVRSADELAALAKLGTTRERVAVRLEFAEVPSETLQGWKTLLESRLNACGCAMGSAFASLALVGTLIWEIRVSHSFPSSWPTVALRVITGVVVGTLIGKYIGMRAARRDLRIIAARIRRQLTTNADARL